MSISPLKRSSAASILAPVGHLLGSKLLSFAKSRLPVANRPRTRHHRAFLSVAPIPFAPLVDTHTFLPPPPYSAYPDDSTDFLPVPHNTPEEPVPAVAEHGPVVGTSAARPVGLGLEGVEKGDGGRFDGLGRLSGGLRATSHGTGDALREQVRRMLREDSRRRRTRAGERPTTRHDVFYASAEPARSVPARTVKVRIRRESAASPTPGWERGTISSELKRAASLERRASLCARGHTTWRV